MPSSLLTIRFLPPFLLMQWLGEPEKSVKAIFSVASKLSPCVVFIDEVDSLLSKRGQDSEHEAMRKVRRAGREKGIDGKGKGGAEGKQGLVGGGEQGRERLSLCCT